MQLTVRLRSGVPNLGWLPLAHMGAMAKAGLLA